MHEIDYAVGWLGLLAELYLAFIHHRIQDFLFEPVDLKS